LRSQCFSIPLGIPTIDRTLKPALSLCCA
jgi:hypothetical protein